MSSKKDDFAALKRTWDKKLAESGFTDIENDNGSLKKFEAKYFASSFEPRTFQATERYYQLAGQLLHDYPFINAKEKHVWRLHASGKNVLEITRELKVTRRYVESIVDRVSRWLRV